MTYRAILISSVLAVSVPVAAVALPFNLDQRRGLIENAPEAASYCMAPNAEITLDLAPITALEPTDEYGSDQAAQDFSWTVMVLGSRALAGDEAASKQLILLLQHWAAAGAFERTPDIHDAHYALKRALLPTVISYGIVRDQTGNSQQLVIDAWLGRLVAKIDRTFDGDVDFNNHRYLADSILAVWSNISRDQNLGLKAASRVRDALVNQLRADGSWPLETRRGARALWYTRQSLASMTLMIQTLRLSGTDLLEDAEIAEGYDKALTFFLDSLRSPSLVVRYAAENYIPGPSQDYWAQDLGFLETRGHDRHYMAWAEMARRMTPNPDLRHRLSALLDRIPADEFPLIDEFSGGNGTCFWGVLNG